MATNAIRPLPSQAPAQAPDAGLRATPSRAVEEASDKGKCGLVLGAHFRQVQALPGARIRSVRIRSVRICGVPCGFKAAWGVGLAGLLSALSGCQSPAMVDPSLPTPRLPPRLQKTVPSPVRFSDITKAAGLRFKHNSGAFGLKLYPETMGSGVAFIDYDGDGYQDIFLANGRDWTPAEVRAYTSGPGRVAHKEYGFTSPPLPPRHRTVGALYHNNGNNTFSDVTPGSGLDIEMQGMGVAVGDYDNDGRPDLYVTSYGRNYLFHNEGKGKFKEVAQAAGVQDAGFSTSAMWVDYDRDGKLDLFVCRYIDWTPATDMWSYGSNAKVRGGYLKTYAGPPGYNGQASRLYHNAGGGRFVDVSAQAGIYKPVTALISTQPSAVRKRAALARDMAMSPPGTMGEEAAKRQAPTMNQGKSMGVALCDYNNDGWPDLLVTNDTVRNYLFLNRKDGTFAEVGAQAGISYSPAGRSRAGMGVDAGDIDHSGRDSFVIGNFDHQYLGLYHNQGQGTFSDIAGFSEVARPSMSFLTFGCVFLDVNNDGWLDIMTADGHVQDTIHTMRHDLDYAQRPLLYLNRRQRQPVKFDEVGLQSGAAMREPRVARGLACADIDLDGDPDVLLTINGGAPVLLRNDPSSPASRNNALRLTLVGTKSNRSAIGALVEARFQKPGQAAGEVVRRMVRSGSSYLSQSELPLTIGMGQQAKAASLTIHWPSGKQTQLRDVPANQALTINEDGGIVRKQALARC